MYSQYSLSSVVAFYFGSYVHNLHYLLTYRCPPYILLTPTQVTKFETTTEAHTHLKTVDEN